MERGRYAARSLDYVWRGKKSFYSIVTPSPVTRNRLGAHSDNYAEFIDRIPTVPNSAGPAAI
jgi:hypothetical protein